MQRKRSSLKALDEQSLLRLNEAKLFSSETETNVTLDRILADLRAERDRIDQAISALEGRGSSHRGRAAGGPRRRRHMSADARRRISEMMKKRWAERKRKAKA